MNLIQLLWENHVYPCAKMCPKCKTLDNNSFCVVCGTKVKSLFGIVSACCIESFYYDRLFCPKCGKNINKEFELCKEKL